MGAPTAPNRGHGHERQDHMNVEVSVNLWALLAFIVALVVIVIRALNLRPTRCQKPDCAGPAFIAGLNAEGNRLKALVTRIEAATDQPRCAVDRAAQAQRKPEPLPGTQKRMPEKPKRQR